MKHKHKWQFAQTKNKIYTSYPRRIERVDIFVCECGANKEVKRK